MDNEDPALPVVLKLPPPVSANRYWASRVYKSKDTGKWMAMTYVTPEAKAYKEEVKWRAVAAGVREPITGRVALDIKMYPHRPLDWQKRVRQLGPNWDDSVQCIDLGNCEKVISDALQGIVIVDDKWIWKQTKERMEPDGEARVVVTITPIEQQAQQPEMFSDGQAAHSKPLPHADEDPFS